MKYLRNNIDTEEMWPHWLSPHGHLFWTLKYVEMINWTRNKICSGKKNLYETQLYVLMRFFPLYLFFYFFISFLSFSLFFHFLLSPVSFCSLFPSPILLLPPFLCASFCLHSWRIMRHIRDLGSSSTDLILRSLFLLF